MESYINQYTSAALFGLTFVTAGLFLIKKWGKTPAERFLFIFLVAMSLFRITLILTTPLDIAGDEAHYWDWSRHLDLSYYSKPPMVAYLIRAGTEMFGHTPLGVRSFAVILSFLSSIALYRLGRRLYSPVTGVWAAVMFNIIPLFAVYSVGMNTDPPLIFFWLLSLLLFHTAYTQNRFWAWLLLGVTLGLGMLSKYMTIFFYPSAFLFLLCEKRYRRYILNWRPYMSIFISFLFFTPVLIWNSRHNWVNFRHELGHTKLAEGLGISLVDFGSFIGLQFAILTPVLFVLVVWALIKRRKTDKLPFLFAVVPVLAFAVKSLQGQTEANWTLIGYVTATLVFSDVFLRPFAELSKKTKTAVIIAIAFCLLADVIVHFPTLPAKLGAPPEYDPTKKLRGWSELGEEVAKVAKEFDGPYFIFSNHYMVTSSLAFYVEGNPRTYWTHSIGRINQYVFWPGFYDFIGYDAIYVEQEGGIRPDVKAAFEKVVHHPLYIHDARGRQVKRLGIWICRNFKGLEENLPEEY